ncbi:AraC-like DNA-binding protein [Aquimarina sp. EL_43]|uniref:AraC family transcriptional regulator n=1 Tax=Aquimarina TaxID=290174 RepID=UPI0004700FD7|nr:MULTISPECIES: AraC family transcriptional regulator [Aquimarina]MBG6130511.1 AraC-like DNA-binding protein [Aquimarina sp. EL_35]MBG6149291.1 AraC-like DNA-binding protein [Aquimarina sp. EL_32]MBG6168335.1 AraC-like DNA-binding protein [Aquimarina sp. EL_43]
MKALPFKIPKSSTDTLIVQEDKEVVFYDKFHQHEEIQISIIISGEGSLIVGDTITDYKANDILIFGSNVPHVLKSASSPIKSYMISLFFTKESFGNLFFKLPEFNDLSGFFRNSVYGIRVFSKKEKLKKQFLKIVEKKEKLDRFTIFLKILKILKTSNIKTISSFISKRAYTDNEGKRMAKVFQVVMNEFNRDFSLKEVADLANMTPNAFCRYFKQRTNKTFFQFLIEVRIENACRLISRELDITISEVSYRSGFKNLSNFNRKFKEIKGMTPSDYKKRLHEPSFS